MTERPLIGLPGRRLVGVQVDGFPGVLADRSLDVYFADYARGVLEAGGLPVHLPLDVAPGDVIERIDGLLLPGGTDVDPALYGAASETDIFPPAPERDAFELGLLDVAAGAALPVLGICRGIQLMNVHAGGTLRQHVPDHACFDLDADTAVHAITFRSDSVLGTLYGDARKVNSLHHQTIDRLGVGYRATGTSTDGVIEAIEAVDRRWIAVQWHPEMMSSRPRDPLFGWLVDEARQ